MKKLFKSPEYTRQDGFVILVRDYRLYRQNSIPSSNTFIPFNGENSIKFDEINFYTDRIYVIPTEEMMCKLVIEGKCLDKFRYKPENTNVNVMTIVKTLDKGKFVGYQTSSHPRKYVVRKNDDVSIRFDSKDESGTIWSDKNHPGICIGCEESFYVFDTEFELWEWVITGK